MKRLIFLLVFFNISKIIFSNIQAGIDLYNKGNIEKSIEILLPYAKKGEKDKRIYWTLFYCYYKKSQFQDAAKWGIEYLKYDSDYPFINKLAEVFFILKQYKNVIRLGQYSNVKYGDQHEIYNLMAMSYYNLKDYKLAEISIRMANTIFPNYYIYRYNYGLILEQIEDYAGAIRQYSRCVELNPSYTQATLALNRVKTKLPQTTTNR